MVKFLQKKMAPVEPPEGDPTKTVFVLLVFSTGTAFQRSVDHLAAVTSNCIATV